MIDWYQSRLLYLNSIENKDMRVFKKRNLLIPLFFVSLTSHAAIMDIYLSGGAAFSSNENNKTVQINELQTNDYVTHTQTVTGPFGGFGIGHTFDNLPYGAVSVMLALSTGYYVGFQEINGTEFPVINDAVFDTLNYKFKAESFVTMAESRIFFNQSKVRPFLLLGVGASWNHMFDYSETPTNPASSAAAIPEVFESNITSSFAYEAGLGVQLFLIKDNATGMAWYGAVEYRYMNMGKGEFTPFPALTANDTLQVGHLAMQAGLLTLQVSIG